MATGTSSLARTCRPLNGYERFFCDDPTRSVGEAKAIALSGVLCGAPCIGSKGGTASLNDVARAWRSAAVAHPYLLCVVDFVRQEGGENGMLLPQLCELDVGEYEANILPHVVTILPPSATPMKDSEAHEAFLRLAREVPFSETRSVATLVVQQRDSGEDVGTNGSMSFYLTLSHIGADARSIFAVARTFLVAWDAICASSDAVNADSDCRNPTVTHPASEAPQEGRVVDLIHAIGIPRIVSNPLRLPILPDGMPPLVPPLERNPDTRRDGNLEERTHCSVTSSHDPPHDAASPASKELLVTCATRHFVFPASDLSLLLAHHKRLGVSIQSVFSAAGALVTLRHQPIRDRFSQLALSEASGEEVSSTTDAAAANTFPCLSLGVQATVQLRDKLLEPLGSSSVLLGGSCVWSYVAISRQSTLLSIARDVEADLRVGLADGRVLGFFKMYLSPPPSPSSSTSASVASPSGLDTVRRQQQASYRPTFNFTNIGLTECSHLERLPRTHAQVSKLDFEFRLTSKHMQPPFGYLRATAHTFLGELRVAVTYTSPHFTSEFVDGFGLDMIHLVQAMVHSVAPNVVEAAETNMPTVEFLLSKYDGPSPF